MRYLAALLGAMLFAAPAIAAPGAYLARTDKTVTGTSGNCLSANGDRSSLTLDATAATANIGFCLIDEGGSSCTAAIGTVGTTTLVAGAIDYWPAGSAPKNGACFISASGSQPLTVREGK